MENGPFIDELVTHEKRWCSVAIAVLNCQAVINLFKTCGWYEKVLFPWIVKIVAVVLVVYGAFMGTPIPFANRAKWRKNEPVHMQSYKAYVFSKIQWIDLREKIQESPIFHGEIDGFL